MKKVLKVLGWIIIPYIMIFIFWKKLNKPLRVAGIIYSVFIIISAIVNGNTQGSVDNSASQQVATSSTTSTSTNTNSVADTEQTQTGADAKQNQADAQKASADQEKQAQATADAKATQRAELQALGDWSIQSNSDDFAKRYTQIQNDIAAGDRQSAYNEATTASKRADDLNSKTMNNQDMNNVPSDIPSNVRDILSGVDPLLATGYMSEKDGFDTLSDAINTNDLSKLNAAKDDFAVANDQFKQAKALIDKANNALK